MENNKQENQNRREELARRKLKLYSKTPRVDTPQKIVDDALAREYPRMGENIRKQLARTIILQPEGRKIKIGNEEKTIADLSVSIADSIEILNSSTSSQEEYHDWINTGQEIITDMNTNGVTREEMDARETFLGDLDQREVELMTCLGLYQRSINDPKVKEKYTALLSKLQKLREIKSAIKHSTENVVTNFEEQEKNRKENEPETRYFPTAAEAALMTATVVALSRYDDLNKQEKQKLNMYHGDDFKDFDFHKNLANYYLYNGDIRFNNKNVGEEQYYETSPLEAKLLEKRSNEKDVAAHIAMLRKGVQTNFDGWKVDTKAMENTEKYQNRGVFARDHFQKVIALKQARGM